MKNYIVFLLSATVLFGAATCVSATDFSDVPTNHWAYQAIERMAAQNIVNGTGNGKFSPESSVSGAEFTAMLTRTFFPDYITATGGNQSWSAPYIAAAETVGLSKDVTITDNPISRADMATLLYNLLNVQNQPTDLDLATVTIPDISSLSAEKQLHIRTAYAKNYLSGVDKSGSFAPYANMTRAEAATLLDRLLNSTAASSDNFVEQVIELVNQARTQEGLAALTQDKLLCAAADIRAEEISRVFSHNRPDGASCFSALREQNISYTAAGENIAAGQATPSDVVQAWLNSEGHRANIMNGKFTSTGVSHTVINGRHYWVQIFIK